MTIRSVVLVLGTTAGGTGTHVRMLAEGFAARGIAVTVYGPSRTNADFGFGHIPGARFVPVELGDRPKPGDLNTIRVLRRLLRAPSEAVPSEVVPSEVAHAHGMRAGALSALALIGVRHAPGLVVTVHNAPPETGRAARLIYLALERLVARRADLVLCVSSDLEQRMRAKGARRVGRAVIPAPGEAAPAKTAPAKTGPPRTGHGNRPVVLAVGRLAPQKDFATLVDAAARWQDREPRPRLVIAGDGPLRDELTRQAERDGVDAEFPGQVDDVPHRLREAAVFVLPSRWEGQPLVLQEALRAGAAIVATRTGGIPDLTGDTGNAADTGAAILVPPGDPRRLASAVREVLADDRIAATLRANARARAATLPSAEQAVTTVLAAYARLPK